MILEAALAFLPVEEVSDSFCRLRDKIGSCNLTDYFDKNHLRGKLLGTTRVVEVRSRARFPVEHWNVRSRAEADIDRTNNVIESFNKQLKMCSNRSHMGLRELVQLLMSMNMKMEHTVKDHLAKGAIMPKKLRKDREREERLLNLVTMYDDDLMNVDDFLYGVQRNICMK